MEASVFRPSPRLLAEIKQMRRGRFLLNWREGKSWFSGYVTSWQYGLNVHVFLSIPLGAWSFCTIIEFSLNPLSFNREVSMFRFMRRMK